MPSGILLLDKPLGLSSNAALQRVRNLFAREKAGHVGSLDPLATGMLPICLGEATKVAGEIVSLRKCYRFSVALGTRTTTGDTEGAAIATAAVPTLQRAAVAALLASRLGPQRQVPPMYSAIKQGGEPLYRLARAGISVERTPRDIELFELRLTDLSAAALEIEVLCSKGTYVRVLAEDIAAALGTVGHVSALRRLYVEPFERQPMHTLDSLQCALAGAQAVDLIRMDHALAHLPAVTVGAEDARRLRLGQTVWVPDASAGRARLYAPAAEFIGLGEVSPAGEVQPRRLLVGRCAPHSPGPAGGEPGA